MSIIYEALKKTQENRQMVHASSTAVKQEVVIPRSNRTKLTLLLLFGIIISAFFAYQKFMLVSADMQNKQRMGTKKTLAAKKIPPNLQVNGTFLSDRVKMAMINHQMYHVGDTIGDMRIIGIETDNVKFRNEQGDISVKAVA